MLGKIERNLPWILIAVGVFLLFGLIAQIVFSLPPQHFTFVTGREGGAYYLYAQMYKEIAAEKGYTIDIMPTAGAIEALHKLEAGEGDVAFVQGGVAAQGNPGVVSSLATVGFEPVWVFYRDTLSPDEHLTSLAQLRDMRIAIGEPGSGTNQLARLLLGDFAIHDSDATLLELSTAQTIDAFKDGAIDAAFIVASHESPTMQELLSDRSLELLNLRHADALARRHNFLDVLTLPEGTLDLVDLSPAEDIRLLTTEANLVVRNDFHPDLLRLLTIAAVEIHSRGGFFADPRYFPNTHNTDLPISQEAMIYVERIKRGDSTFDRYLPFWAAAVLDRYLLFILPMLLIVLPLLGRSPMLYVLYMRNKINRWYKVVQKIELRVDKMELSEIDAAIAELEELDDKIAHELTVSNAYIPNVYDLRTHVQYVAGQVMKRRERLTGQPAPVMEPPSPDAVGAAPLGQIAEQNSG